MGGVIDYIETSIIDNIQNSMFLETLSEENQAIVKLLVDGHSQANIAKLLSNKENSVSVKQIYTKVNSIKKKIVEYYYG
jgi:DNA-binding NarL/FixJ family response regulator